MRVESNSAQGVERRYPGRPLRTLSMEQEVLSVREALLTDVTGGTRYEEREPEGRYIGGVDLQTTKSTKPEIVRSTELQLQPPR